ncbi:MAG: S8 family serine peptidase [Gemmatimonadota bacterium]|nr:MAG: S8 family serine peptidase [Gemmatimonadota bacterium]
MALRRIVVLREHEPLQKGWRAKSFDPAGSLLDDIVKVTGMEFDYGYHPVHVPGRVAVPAERPAASGFNYGTAGAVSAYCVRSDFEDEDAIARLRYDRRGEVAGVFADPAVSVFAQPYCGASPVGTVKDVERELGVSSLRSVGLTGRRVNVVVVDTGIDGTMIPVYDGWAPVPGYVPGSAARNHGTMVAYDVRIAAPGARIYDYALLRSQAGTWTAFLSDGIAAFADIMDRMSAQPGRWVVNNSWGLYNRADDAPIGSPENYSANPDHPFNQIVGTLVAAGADVFFAAGNCGADCPDGRCGAGDRGSGASIHGANSHPDVVTVAAVTVTDRRLGYSSQGPGGLYPRKPDVAAYSHFKGSEVYQVDGGTSAASPVAAGVAAALRQKFNATRLTPAALKGLLQRTARDLEGQGWDYDVGYGVISAKAIVKSLGLRPRAKRPVIRTAKGRAKDR